MCHVRSGRSLQAAGSAGPASALPAASGVSAYAGTEEEATDTAPSKAILDSQNRIKATKAKFKELDNLKMALKAKKHVCLGSG